MKNPKQNAERWLKEANYTFRQAGQTCDAGAYNLTCFLAEQTAQKSLKAVLYFDGARFITIHSVAELIKEVSKNHPEFLELKNRGAILDQYYLSTRYPDAVPEPAVPAELFGEKQAKEAIEIAKKIFNTCEAVVAGN